MGINYKKIIKEVINKKNYYVIKLWKNNKIVDVITFDNYKEVEEYTKNTEAEFNSTAKFGLEMDGKKMKPNKLYYSLEAFSYYK